MRIRLPFAGAFAASLLLAAYLGLGTVQIPQINDKVLHCITFFILTLTFYWIVDTTRRRAFNLTLFFVTICLGLGSEALQGILPNGRKFDLLDIAANILGSIAALGLNTLYHNRMLDRRRRKKGYGAVTQVGESEDLEMGRPDGQETGVVDAANNWDNEAHKSSEEDEGRMTPGSIPTGDESNDP